MTSISNGNGGLDDVVLVYEVPVVGTGGGSLTNRYLHGAGIDEILADEDALNEILWGFSDHQGTVRNLARYDAAAETTAVTAHRRFDSFGNPLSETNPATNSPLAGCHAHRFG